MLIPPHEHVLLLAERWLKLLCDLGRAQATLTAPRFCILHGIKPVKARFEDHLEEVPWPPKNGMPEK